MAYLIICRTPGCSQDSIEGVAHGYPQPDWDGPISFFCGSCGQQITDVTEVPDDYQPEPPPDDGGW